jgi:hypothetical protein
VLLEPRLRARRPLGLWFSLLGTLAAVLTPAAAAASEFAEAAARGTAHAFLFALTAGLLTSLTPCVYPMTPITVGIFGARGGSSRGRAFLLATVYVAGIAVMFGVLGTSFALLGKAFGTFLANPWVVVPLTLFFFAMAASMFGAFDLALPSALPERLARVGGRGFVGAFLMGLVGGIIAELHKFLGCGILARGLAKLFCPTCHEHCVVGWSCRGRLVRLLEESSEQSQLPEAPTARPALHDLLVRLRLGGIHTA